MKSIIPHIPYQPFDRTDRSLPEGEPKTLRQNQAMAGLEYLAFGKGPATSSLIEGGAFWWGDKCEALPDCQFFLVCGAGIEEGVDGVPGGNGCTINLGQVRPHSRGEVTP
ncbi:MAG: hypothetical protein RLN70_07105 [Rhodospirillaceae bacterium]